MLLVIIIIYNWSVFENFVNWNLLGTFLKPIIFVFILNIFKQKFDLPGIFFSISTNLLTTAILLGYLFKRVMFLEYSLRLIFLVYFRLLSW